MKQEKPLGDTIPRWYRERGVRLSAGAHYGERTSTVVHWVMLVLATYFHNFATSRSLAGATWRVAGNLVIILAAIINVILTAKLVRGETPERRLDYAALVLDMVLVSVIVGASGALFSLYFVPTAIAMARFGAKVGGIYAALGTGLYLLVATATALNGGVVLPSVLIAHVLALALAVGAVVIISRGAQVSGADSEYYDRVSRDLEELTILQEVSQILLRDLTKRDKILDNVAAVIRRRLAHPYCALLLLNPAQDTMHVEAGWGVAEGSQVPLGQGGAGWVAKTGIPLRVDDLAQESRYGHVDDDVRSELCVPLKIEDHVIGVIDLRSPEVGAFSEDEMRMLTTVANQVALALENARLFEEIRRFNIELEQRVQERTEELATLYELARTVTSTLKLQEVTQLVIELVEQAFAVEAASMLLLDQETKELVFETAMGVEETKLIGRRLKLEQGIVGYVATTKKPLIVPDVREESHFYPWIDAITGFTTKSALCVPLLAKDRVLGVIELLNKHGGKFVDSDLERLKAFAASVAIAIENAALYADLNRANEAKSEFVRFVSHEMRTPMTSIKGYADMILSGMAGEITDTQRRFLTIVRNNTGRLSGLVSDLLDISRIETGKLKLHFHLLQMKEIAEEVAGTLAGLAEQSKVSLTMEFPDNLPAIVGDHDRMNQILTNLTGNALKYTPEKGQIWVRGTAVTVQDGHVTEVIAGDEPFGAPPAKLHDGAWILVGIKDTGIGIAVEEQHKVFQQFFRADHELARERRGTGLGLNITKSLVEAHRGQIWFESEPKVGSVFSFAIPLAGSPHAPAIAEEDGANGQMSK